MVQLVNALSRCFRYAHPEIWGMIQNNVVCTTRACMGEGNSLAPEIKNCLESDMTILNCCDTMRKKWNKGLSPTLYVMGFLRYFPRVTP